MKYLITTFVLIISMMINAQSTDKENRTDNRQYIVEVGDEAPDFEMQMPNGEVITLSSLRGKLVMLQFTASWCGVCRKEMPHIEQEIWLKHKDNPDFALYGIDLKESAQEVIDFQNKMGTSYPIGLDLDGSIFYKYAEQNAGVTRNIIINPDGEIIMLTRLFDEKEFASMVSLIDSFLSAE